MYASVRFGAINRFLRAVVKIKSLVKGGAYVWVLFFISRKACIYGCRVIKGYLYPRVVLLACQGNGSGYAHFVGINRVFGAGEYC